MAGRAKITPFRVLAWTGGTGLLAFATARGLAQATRSGAPIIQEVRRWGAAGPPLLLVDPLLSNVHSRYFPLAPAGGGLHRWGSPRGGGYSYVGPADGTGYPLWSSAARLPATPGFARRYCQGSGGGAPLLPPLGSRRGRWGCFRRGEARWRFGRVGGGQGCPARKMPTAPKPPLAG